jgi:hypothetical protein
VLALALAFYSGNPSFSSSTSSVLAFGLDSDIHLLSTVYLNRLLVSSSHDFVCSTSTHQRSVLPITCLKILPFGSQRQTENQNLHACLPVTYITRMSLRQHFLTNRNKMSDHSFWTMIGPRRILNRTWKDSRSSSDHSSHFRMAPVVPAT